MKMDIDDITVGLDRLSAMITVFGTYASWNRCETDDVTIAPHVVNNAYDMIADYARMLGEQLQELEYPKSASE